MLNALSFCSLLTYVSHRKSENYFPNVLGSTYLEILRDDLTNIIIIFYAVFKEQNSFMELFESLYRSLKTEQC